MISQNLLRQGFRLSGFALLNATHNLAKGVA
jgi:hypothetical protein